MKKMFSFEYNYMNNDTLILKLVSANIGFS